MTSIIIEPQASLDIEEAASWYENQLIGLGVEFLLEVDFSIEKIQNNPKLYLQSYHSARRTLLRRFPYAITLFYKQVEIRNGLPFNVVIPTSETLKTFEATDAEKDLVVCKDADEMFEKLGL